MFELWVPVTIAAAFFQNLRSALQKHLKGRLSTTGATFVRFGFGFPLALLYVAGLAHLAGLPLPHPGPAFALFAALGAVAQILGTVCLISLFSARNFAVGTTYSKTETLQTALFGIVILGDALTFGALLGILVSLAGVLAISVAQGGETPGAGTWRTLLTAWTSRSALVGLASGGFYGIAAVSYRAASLSLGGEGFLMQAAFTLACVTVLQTLLMLTYMRLREPGQITATLAAWKTSVWVGASGIAASACWFTAMTIQNAAYVRALGQVELVFTFVAGHFVFRERSTRLEITGILLVIAGILCLLVLR